MYIPYFLNQKWATMPCWSVNNRKGSIKMIDVKIELYGKKYNYLCTLLIFFLFFGYYLARLFLLVQFLFFVDALLYECVFSCVFSCTSSFLRRRFLVRVRVCVFSCTSACLRACFLVWVRVCVHVFLHECVFACFRACFLVRVRVFFLACFRFSFYKFPALAL